MDSVSILGEINIGLQIMADYKIIRILPDLSFP